MSGKRKAGVELTEDEVELFEHRDYRSRLQKLKPGRYNNTELSNAANRISSLRVPPGLRVTLFEHADFKGKSSTFDENSPYIGDTLNDRASSIVVEQLEKRRRRDDQDSEAEDSGQHEGGPGADAPPEMKAKYDALGGRRSVLGAPRGPAKEVEGGWIWECALGNLYYWVAPENVEGPAGGAFEVHGKIFERYQDLGGVRSELGWPIADEQDLDDSRARVSTFLRGSIVFSKAKTWKVTDHFGGWYRGKRMLELGPPTSESSTVSGYEMQDFERGRLYYKDGMGITVFSGPIYRRYMRERAHQGPLGLPTNGGLSRSPDGPGKEKDEIKCFQRGAIGYRVGDSEAFLIDEAFYKVLFQNIKLAWPTGEKRLDPEEGMEVQPFENGKIGQERGEEPSVLGPLELDVRLTEFKCIAKKEGGDADFRVNAWIDGVHKMECTFTNIDNSEVRRFNHCLRVTKDGDQTLLVRFKCEEHDGGFDSGWTKIDDKTRAFARSSRWGLRSPSTEKIIVLDGNEGTVSLKFEIAKVGN